MTEVEKKGIGKAKVGLIVSTVLVIILVISNVWTYASLQNQINTLNNDKNNLQFQITSLQTWLDGNKTLLNQTQIWLNENLILIDTLNAQISNL